MFSRISTILIVSIMLIVIGVVQQVTADTSELPRIRPIPLMRFGGAFLGSSTDLVAYVWYIEGANSRIIVDAGMVETAGIQMGGWVLSSLDDGLARVGLRPEDVDTVIFTHLHPDHVGYANRFTNARLIVQNTELEAYTEGHPYFDLIKDLDFETISGDQQIDDNVQVLLTPGHTPGGQSVLVETAAGKAVITGYCCTMEHFEPTFTPPPRTEDPDGLIESMQRVAEIADILVPLHDHRFADIDAIPTENLFFMSLAPGLNMISLPLEPITPYTARSFAEYLSSTVVIKLDEGHQRFVGFTLDAPDNGFAIEGGKGYIVNIPESKVVTFTGTAWTNQPPVEMAPFAQSDGVWAFVVSGKIDDSSTKDGYQVTIRNTRTNEIATDVVREGYFAAAFADLARRNVVQIGDRLEVSVRDRAGEIASETIPDTVTPETIHQAFLPLVLKNVGIPLKSLLLPNYPNPFNPETWIPYQIREPAEVMIRVYNAQGRLVRTLNLGQREAGFYLGRSRAASWDGHNDAGEKVSSGVYFYQIQADYFNATRKLVIVK